MAGSILVQASKIKKSFGGIPLYDSVDFSIYEGEKIALYGPNGSGKSTLFNLMSGKLEADSGEIHQANGLILSYLKQNQKKGLDLNLDEYLGQHESALPTWEVKKIAAGLGLKEEDFSKKLELLSGGFRMRFYLSCELAREPDLILLDEPTNHLDLESVLFLENYLKSYKKAFILISHDRELIQNVCTSCLVIEPPQVLKYNGDLDSYFLFSQEQKERMMKENKKIDEKKKQLEEFVNKFRAKASKAKQAQSKLKAIDRLGDKHSLPLEYFPSVPIPQAQDTGKRILDSSCEAGLGYPNKTNVLKSFELSVFRGDKIGIVGENGAGKSTLLKHLASILKDQTGNTPHYYKNVSPSYFAQHLEQELPLQKKLLDYIMEKAPKDLTEQQILDLIGGLGFDESYWNRRIEVLSGGEKMRVVLCEILLKKSALLLLDEPTNHLDFQTVESLAKALNKSECSILLVSHDRSFVDQVCNKIFEIKDNELHVYPGSYQEYVWSTQNRKKESLPSVSPEPNDKSITNTSSKMSGGHKLRKKELEKEIRKLEKSLDNTHLDMERLEQKILDTNEELLKSPNKASALAIELSQLGDKKLKSEEQWLELSEQIDSLKSELKDLLG